jgi:hypothetical protein
MQPIKVKYFICFVVKLNMTAFWNIAAGTTEM